MAVNLVLPDRSVFGRVHFAAVLVLVVVAWPLPVRDLRRLRACPRC